MGSFNHLTILLVLGLFIIDNALSKTVPDEVMLVPPSDGVVFSEDTHDDVEEKPDVELGNQQPPLGMDAPNSDINGGDLGIQPLLMSDQNITAVEDIDPTRLELQELKHRLGELNRQLLTMSEQPAAYSNGQSNVIHRGVG